MQERTQPTRMHRKLRPWLGIVERILLHVHLVIVVAERVVLVVLHLRRQVLLLLLPFHSRYHLTRPSHLRCEDGFCLEMLRAGGGSGVVWCG
jgi:hypothetical protein